MARCRQQARREGRPSDDAVLSARIVDRTIRPLFSHTLRHEIQVVVTVLAVGEDDPGVAMLFALAPRTAALHFCVLSDAAGACGGGAFDAADSA